MAVSANEGYATLQALHKNVYSEKGIQDAIPNHCVLQKLAKFTQKELSPTGLQYNRPVRLKRPASMTFVGAGGGAAQLATAQAGKVENATIQANSILEREILDYETAARAVKSKAAYVDATQFLMEAMMEAAKNQLELNFLWGQKGLATYGGTTSTTTVTNDTINITAAEWGPGIWTGMEGHPIDIYDSTGATFRGQVVISQIDLDNSKLVFETAVPTLTNGDVLWRGSPGLPGNGTKPAGTTAFNEAIGLAGIIGNTGTLFGISATTYSLWKASTQTASSGPLTFLLAQKLAAKARIRGFASDGVLLVSTDGWNNLLTDQAALRRYAGNEGKAGKFEQGAEELMFHGQTGVIRVVAHPMMKNGYAFLIEDDDILERVGATDWTFRVPGSDLIVRDLPDAMGYEYRLFTNQSLFCSAPGHLGQITSIVNS